MSEYQPIAGLDGVYSVHKGNLRSIAIVLKDGSLCVISPIVGLPGIAYESLNAIGPVRHVLAPNHYHHKGIGDFIAVYPGANAYANPGAAERLASQTKASFRSLDPLKELLGKGVSFLQPAGLKSGEVWLRFASRELTAWMVVDAFCGPKLKKLAAESKQPELLKTFPSYGVADKAVYGSWAEKQARKDKPTLLVPCHGSVVRSADLTRSLTALAHKLSL